MSELEYEVNNTILVRNIEDKNKFLVMASEGYCDYYLVERIGKDLCFTAYDKEDGVNRPGETQLTMVVATWHYDNYDISELLDLLISEYTNNRCIGTKWVTPTLEYRERYPFKELKVGQHYLINYMDGKDYTITKIGNDFVEFCNENTRVAFSQYWYDLNMHSFDYVGNE